MRQGGQGRQGRKFNHAMTQNKVVRLLATQIESNNFCCLIGWSASSVMN